MTKLCLNGYLEMSTPGDVFARPGRNYGENGLYNFTLSSSNIAKSFMKQNFSFFFYSKLTDFKTLPYISISVLLETLFIENLTGHTHFKCTFLQMTKTTVINRIYERVPLLYKNNINSFITNYIFRQKNNKNRENYFK